MKQLFDKMNTLHKMLEKMYTLQAPKPRGRNTLLLIAAQR